MERPQPAPVLLRVWPGNHRDLSTETFCVSVGIPCLCGVSDMYETASSQRISHGTEVSLTVVAGVAFLLFQSCLGIFIAAPQSQVRVVHPFLPEFLQEVLHSPAHRRRSIG